MSEINKPARHFGDRISLFQGRGGLPELRLRFADATLVVCLQGAHICSYQPVGSEQADVLWMSNSAHFATGKPIRGGIPLCWPWFGAHWQDKKQPQHGYARTSNFELLRADASDLCTSVVLGRIEDNTHDNGLHMEFEVRLSDRLWIEVRTTNRGESAVEVGAALHSYFQVTDISAVRIPELQGLQYRDKTRDFQSFTQAQPLIVDSEVDRVYRDAPSIVHLLDGDLGRQLEIQSWGNTDLVVWNPWQQKALAMDDFDDHGYGSMICIEPANALENRVLLEPSQQSSIGKTIRLLG